MKDNSANDSTCLNRLAIEYSESVIELRKIEAELAQAKKVSAMALNAMQEAMRRVGLAAIPLKQGEFEVIDWRTLNVGDVVSVDGVVGKVVMVEDKSRSHKHPFQMEKVGWVQHDKKFEFIGSVRDLQ